MAHGEVIGCWRTAPDNLMPGIIDPRVAGQSGIAPKRIVGGGNHLWVRHDDGNIALYAHAQPGSIPERLCPNGTANGLLPAEASPSMGDPDIEPQAYVPPGADPTEPTGSVIGGVEIRRPRVRQGEVLGLIGNSGNTPGGPHLHVHVETGFTTTRSQPTRMEFKRGLFGLRVPPPANEFLHQANINNWVSFSGSTLPDSPVLVWPPTTLAREVHRVGIGAEAFGRVFDHLSNSGFMPEVLDCYYVNGGGFFNMLWRPAQGAWSAVIGVDELGLLTAVNENSSLSVYGIDICASPSGPRYTAILRAIDGGSEFRTSLTEIEHDMFLQEMRAAGMTPVGVSVTSISGERVYAVVYRDVDWGVWTVASRLRRTAQVDEYDDFVDQAFDEFRKPVYVSAYMHGGVEHFVSIVAERPDGKGKALHDRTTEQMRTNIEGNVFQGFMSRSVAGTDGASVHRHAAVWIDPPAIAFNDGFANPGLGGIGPGGMQPGHEIQSAGFGRSGEDRMPMSRAEALLR